jgi:hypothetical protein
MLCVRSIRGKRATTWGEIAVADSGEPSHVENTCLHPGYLMRSGFGSAHRLLDPAEPASEIFTIGLVLT